MKTNKVRVISIVAVVLVIITGVGFYYYSYQKIKDFTDKVIMQAKQIGNADITYTDLSVNPFKGEAVLENVVVKDKKGGVVRFERVEIRRWREHGGMRLKVNGINTVYAGKKYNNLPPIFSAAFKKPFNVYLDFYLNKDKREFDIKEYRIELDGLFNIAVSIDMTDVDFNMVRDYSLFDKVKYEYFKIDYKDRGFISKLFEFLSAGSGQDPKQFKENFIKGFVTKKELKDEKLVEIFSDFLRNPDYITIEIFVIKPATLNELINNPKKSDVRLRIVTPKGDYKKGVAVIEGG